MTTNPLIKSVPPLPPLSKELPPRPSSANLKIVREGYYLAIGESRPTVMEMKIDGFETMWFGVEYVTLGDDIPYATLKNAICIW